MSGVSVTDRASRARAQHPAVTSEPVTSPHSRRRVKGQDYSRKFATDKARARAITSKQNNYNFQFRLILISLQLSRLQLHHLRYAVSNC